MDAAQREELFQTYLAGLSATQRAAVSRCRPWKRYRVRLTGLEVRTVGFNDTAGPEGPVLLTVQADVGPEDLEEIP